MLRFDMNRSKSSLRMKRGSVEQLHLACVLICCRLFVSVYAEHDRVQIQRSYGATSAVRKQNPAIGTDVHPYRYQTGVANAFPTTIFTGFFFHFHKVKRLADVCYRQDTRAFTQCGAQKL